MCKCECENVNVCVTRYVYNCESIGEDCLSSVTLYFRLTRAIPVRERNKQKGQCCRHIFTIKGYQIKK